MRDTDRFSFDTLEYAKGTISGLLNFSIRSGLMCPDGMQKSDPDTEEEYKNPAFRCRCGYEAALQTAILCIESMISEKKANADRDALHQYPCYDNEPRH